MNTYGLIGFPLGHSFSEGFFANKFEKEGIAANNEYRNFPLESINDFPKLLADHPTLRGLNVTIPYKEAIIPYLTGFSDNAKEIGAVNTIEFINGQLIGHNTDVIGFSISLNSFLEVTGRKPEKALILGTGGAAKAIAFVLKKMKISSQFVSRKKSNNNLTYNELSEEIIGTVGLIVNTTPLGTFPAIETCPDIPYHCLSDAHRLYDLVYNPPQTLFLTAGLKYGAHTQNGLKMLEEQALASWNIWNKTQKSNHERSW